MKGSRICDTCGKSLASTQSLWNHKQRCKSSTNKAPYHTSKEKIPTFNGSEFGTNKPKSRATLDKMMQYLNVPVHRRDKIVGGMIEQEPQTTLFENEILDEILDEEQKEQKSPLKTIVYDELMKYMKPPLDEEDKDEERILESELKKRFRKLFCQLTREGKEENRKELILLLDEMLKNKFIMEDEYESLNDILTQSPATTTKKSCDDEESREDLIQSTIDYLIKHDKEELNELIDEIGEEVGEDFTPSIIKLEDLIKKFLINEYSDGEPILPQILEIVENIENSPSVSLSKPFRVKVLLNDIAENRYRVNSILTRLKNEKSVVDYIAKQLMKEELISHEQYEKLMEEAEEADAEINYPIILSIIKDTKIGQGIKLLPRKVKDLKKKLQLILSEVTRTGIDTMKKELFAIIDELLRQNGITPENHAIIKNDLKSGEGLWLIKSPIGYRI